VELNPLIVQAGIAIPISFGLVVYTLLRWDRSTLHLMLAGLLTSVCTWLGAMVIKTIATTPWIRDAALDVEIGSVIFMPALFLITMALFARSALFETNQAPAISLVAVSALFFVGLLTDPHHGLFFADRDAALASASPIEWGGPLYWAVQIWCGICDLLALGYCGSVVTRGRNRSERGRALMVFAAVVTPIVGHFVYLSGILPIDFTLAPGALGASAFFFVQGVHRYGLLDVQPLVRHDLIEYLDDGLLLADTAGVVLDANVAAEELLGIPRERLRGHPLSDIVSMLKPMENDDAFEQRIASLPLEGDSLNGEVRTRDGRYIELTAAAVTALGSQPAGRFISLSDRTAQRRSERLLRERQKLESVGVLAAGVAHEVNNPLAYVRSNLVHLQSVSSGIEKHLRLGSSDSEDGADLLEIPEVLAESIEGLDRIARIVAGLLRFSRVPDEKTREVDVHQVVDEALRLAALERDSAVHVEMRGEATPLPPVLGSPERLIQVLLNLFLNGKQALANQPDARILADTRLEEGEVVIRVRDNGPGIAEALQARIFDPFFTTRGPDEGTGLGLSIAFDIVQEHGGTLEVESIPGEGTCFVIRLPAANVDWKS
jgi:PAS domain S-box-containing protein